MLINSPRKKATHINILNFEKKTWIKYLGVYIDQHLNWKDQITHVKNKVSKNIGILYKLRQWVYMWHVSNHVLKQLYYTLIYPYINYAPAVVWGNTYPSYLNKLCSLQNNCIRCMFSLIVESHPKFSINFLIFLNLITLLNWVVAVTGGTW